MTKFQLALTIAFGVFIFAGVVIFATGKLGNSSASAQVTVWGSLTPEVFEVVSNTAGFTDKSEISITYKQVREENFDKEFIEALASGVGPDIFMLQHTDILKHQDKIAEISFKSVPERDFKDIFIEEGELFMTDTGILAVPFMVNPLVMYWNRSMFTNAGISQPPKFWSEFYDLAPLLTKKDTALNVTKSAIAFGEYANVSHAPEILGLLTMQAGGAVSVRRGEKVESVLSNGANNKVPANAALAYFTEFVNPVKPHYSWNRAQLLSKNVFTFGDLATYFGFASEIFDIQNKNPNLNFDVAKMPQSIESEYAMTYANIDGLAITKASKNKTAAITVALALVGNAPLAQLSLATRLPPVRRDLLAVRQTDAYLGIFYQSALQARGWLTPAVVDSNMIFKDMIEGVTSGRRSVSEAVSRANNELDVALLNILK